MNERTGRHNASAAWMFGGHVGQRIIHDLSRVIVSGSLIVVMPENAWAQSAQTAAASNSWWSPLASALIGAAAALMTILVKDVIVQRWNETRSKSNQQRDIFRNYAAPLAAACEKIIWRISEVFLEERHHFLKSATLPLVFNEYKRKSTLYRIAALLGWIRALNLELAALPRGSSGFLTPIAGAIANVQGALADGPHVELHRLTQFCAVWGLDLRTFDEQRQKSLAGQFEVRLYGLAGDKLKQDSDHLKNLEREKQLEICRSLSDFLCSELRRAPVPDEVVHETLGRAISGLSYREALIYRDWQDALGDSVLEPDSDSVRRFKIVGYERFEEILKGESLWIRVFRDSIVDIDFDAMDPNDFRVKQLGDFAFAVSNILISLSRTDEADLVSEAALTKAHKLAARTKPIPTGA